MKRNIVVVGAGLTGCFLAALLSSEQHYRVSVYEKLTEEQLMDSMEVRSINITLCKRGRTALSSIDGLLDAVIEKSQSLHGFQMHSKEKHLASLYSNSLRSGYVEKDSLYLSSIRRGNLHKLLLQYAQKQGAQFFFAKPLEDVGTSTLTFGDEVLQLDDVFLLVGADGVGSRIRRKWTQETKPRARFYYAQVSISDEANFSREAFHMWRGSKTGNILIGIPNNDGTIGSALFSDGNPPGPLEQEFEGTSILSYGTFYPLSSCHSVVYSLPDAFANHKVNAFLVGDSAHAMLPFFGQGANSAFEDCIHLRQVLNNVIILQELHKLTPPQEKDLLNFKLTKLHNKLKPNLELIVDISQRQLEANFYSGSNLQYKNYDKTKIPDGAPLPSIFALVSFSTLPYLDCFAQAAEIVAEISYSESLKTRQQSDEKARAESLKSTQPQSGQQ